MQRFYFLIQWTARKLHGLTRKLHPLYDELVFVNSHVLWKQTHKHDIQLIHSQCNQSILLFTFIYMCTIILGTHCYSRLSTCVLLSSVHIVIHVYLHVYYYPRYILLFTCIYMCTIILGTYCYSRLSTCVLLSSVHATHNNVY